MKVKAAQQSSKANPHRHITQLRPIPMELVQEDFKPRYVPEDFGCAEQVFPLVPRRFLRNRLLAEGVTEIRAEIYVPQSNTDKDLAFPLPHQFQAVPKNVSNFSEIPLTRTAVSIGKFRPEESLEGRTNFRSHPSFDPSGIWIRSLDIQGPKKRKSSISEQTYLARFLKEMLKVATLTEAHMQPKHEIWLHLRPWLDEEVEGFKIQNLTLPLTHPRSAFVAEAVWNLDADHLELKDLIPAKEIGQNLFCKAVRLHKADRKTLYYKINRRSKEFFHEYLSRIPDFDPEKFQYLQIDLRQNPFPDSEDSLSAFCPVRDFFQAADDKGPKGIFEPESGESEYLDTAKMEHAKYQPRSLRSLFVWNPETKEKLHLVAQHAWSLRIATHLTSKWNFPLFHTQPAGFDSTPVFEQNHLTQTSKELIKISQDYIKKISSWILKDPQFADNRQIAKDLKTMQKYIHPLLPRGWTEPGKELIHVSLEHAIQVGNNWNALQNHYTGIHQGILPGILRKKHRHAYGQLLVDVITNHLAFPVPQNWLRDLAEREPGFAKLKEATARKFSDAILQFARDITPSDEIGRIAGCDPIMEYNLCADYLKRNPANIGLCRMYPPLLAVLTEMEHHAPHGVFINSINDDINVENEITNQQLLDSFGKGEVQDLEVLHSHVLANQNLASLPKGKLRRYLASFPVFIHFNSSENEPRCEFPEIPFHRDSMKQVVDYMTKHAPYVYNLQTDLMPENPAEWIIFHCLCWKSYLGKNFWTGVLQTIRKRKAEVQARSYRDVANEDAEKPDWNIWSLDMDKWLTDSTADYWNNTWQQTRRDLTGGMCFEADVRKLIGVLKEIAEFRNKLDEIMKKFSENSLLEEDYVPGGKEYLETLQKWTLHFEKTSSRTKTRDIAHRWGLQSPKFPELERKASVWPKVVEVELFSWKPALLEEIATQNGNFTLQELTSEDEVIAYGKVMEHCIATYASNCIREATNQHIVDVKSAFSGKSIATATIEELVGLEKDDTEKTPPPRFHLSQTGGVRNVDVTPEIMKFFNEAARRMEINAESGDYDWRESRSHRRNMERIWTRRSHIQADQDLWMCLESFKVLREINPDLPKCPQLSDEEIQNLLELQFNSKGGRKRKKAA